MKRILCILGWIGAVLPVLAHAEIATDPGMWIERVNAANKRLNFVGTFTYQSGKRSEVSRIIHRIDEHGEYERIEALDGRPREMVRSGNEVRYLIPEKHMLIVDRLIARRTFPSWVSTSVSELQESYQFKPRGHERVAGMQAQMIEVMPKDPLRYKHVLWIDQETGLLLKSVMLSEQGDILEQVSFNEVRIGGNVDRLLLKASYYDTSNWYEINLCGSEIQEYRLDWRLHEPLPGFKLVSSTYRSLGEMHGEVVHLVLSDGLVAVSVFIEALPKDLPASSFEPAVVGATSIYKRVLGEHLITVLGEVPLHTVQKLGNTIERTRQ